MQSVKSDSHRLRCRQLDKQLKEAAYQNIEVPKHGFIREIRNALGITATQLASRLHLSQPSITQLENSEVAGSISLNTLHKAAEALNCKLVYTLVPHTTLEDSIQQQAKAAASYIHKRISRSMLLENQAITESEESQQIEELAQELIRSRSRQIWEYPADGDTPSA